MPAAERGRILWKMAEKILERGQDLALLETLDTGKTLFDSGKVEIPMAAQIFQFFAGAATQDRGPDPPGPPGRVPVHAAGTGRGRRRHRSVELPVPARVVEGRAGARRRLRRDPQAGEPDPAHRDRDGPDRTRGGAAAGRAPGPPGGGAEAGHGAGAPSRGGQDRLHRIAPRSGRRSCARPPATLKRVTVELGGKSPNVVFADADLEAALRGAFNGIFYNKGEVCAAGSRLLVEKSVHEEFVAKLAERADAITLGDPARQGDADGAGRVGRADEDRAGLHRGREERRGPGRRRGTARRRRSTAGRGTSCGRRSSTG